MKGLFSSIRVGVALLFFSLFCGCMIGTGFGRGPKLATGASPPAIAVHYFPYGPAFSRTLFAPVPEYRGWTNERMERDLSRMAHTGIDVVVVRVELGEFLSDDYRRERFERFVALASSSRFGDLNVPQIVFEVVRDEPVSQQGFGRFLEWFVSKDIGAFSSYYRRRGRALVLLGPALIAVAARHPAVCFEAGGGRGSSWRWGALGTAGAMPDAKACRVLIRAGGLDGVDERGRPVWSVPRRGGRTLRTAFREVLAQGPKMVLISSWNDYESGDFIEPNSLDGSRVLTVLREELSRLRAEGNTQK
ncbi:MAG: hypothetical protein GXP31_09455 [Kiritimatiellaeota bacterium]|nr:hypothetical protein [Kiritimatiellota bacterium]